MRLGVAAALCALLTVAAALPDAEDLPPVDELVGQLIAGELKPEDVVDMAPRMSPEYVHDVKNGLPDELRQRVVEVMHSHHPVEPEPEPVEEELLQGEDYTEYYDGDDYDEDMYAEEEEEDLAPEEEEPELAPVEEPIAVEEDSAVLRAAPGLRAEPAEEEDSGVLRAAPGLRAEPVEEEEDSGVLRAAPGLRAGPMEDSGTGGSSGGGSGASAGGVLPLQGSEVVLDDATAARQLLEYSRLEKSSCQARYQTDYEFFTSDHTLGPNKVNVEVAYMKLWREFAENSTQFDLSQMDSTDLVALFMLLRHAGAAALNDEQLNQLITAVTNLETKFANAKVCDFFDDSKCDLKLYRDIRVKLASSTDRDELSHYWLTWRGLVGRGSSTLYADYVRLLDTAAKMKSPDSDAWALMTYPYRHGNSYDIIQQLEQLWEQDISPLYEQLHSYARIRLRQRYGSDAVPAEGPLPAHLLGSHEADDWSALEPIMRPFDNASTLDFHGQCIQQSIDVGTLKQEASSLYWSLGLNKTSLSELTVSWLNVAAPNAENVLFLPRVLDGCHSGQRSAVGIYPTNTTLSDYIELIELFATMQRYKERQQSLTADTVGFPYKDRLGYNDYGLDLAIGGARALTAISPEGLRQKLKFQIFDTSESSTMNFQMAQALKLLPRLAASMAAARWQFDVLTGLISEGQYNDRWWQYKREFQGVSPPEERGNDQFDALADGTITLPNYHLRRLIGGIAMFSMHEYQCRMYGGGSDPVSECAIFVSTELGENIKTVLVSGNKKPLSDQLQALTGQKSLTADALKEWMQPLADWLVTYNAEHGEEGGGVGENTEVIAIIVGVVIAVIVIGLVIFFAVSRRKQKYQDYKGAPTREGQAPQQA